MRELSLAMLRDSGLALDWQTVYIGWQGFPLHPYHENIRLPNEEVRDFAYDSLGDAEEPEVQHALAELIDFDTNASYWNAMSRYGQILTERSGLAKLGALRKWRYAMVWQFLHTQSENGGKDNYFPVHPWESILQGWNELVVVHSIPEIDSAYFSEVDLLLCLSKIRLWVIEEGRYLAGTGQMAQPSALLL